MPPKDEHYDCNGTCSSSVPTDKENEPVWERYTYQVTYVNDAGVEITELIEATHVHTDDDHAEIWDGDILLFMEQRPSLRRIRNVSRLDMGPVN